MAYYTPYIDETGIHIPTYTDIRNHLVDEARRIFGQDIYLAPDSADYVYISIMAEKIYDSYQLAAACFADRSPATATGVGLSSLVKLNGLRRHGASRSVATVELMGTAGTKINGGVIKDAAGEKWDLPTAVLIGSEGKATVEAKTQRPGKIVALAGEINQIETPVYGWDSVANILAAVPGSEIETDARLRYRQSISTQAPSRTILEGAEGAVLALTGVTRAVSYENDTAATDEHGLPPHSICLVVEGGEEEAIAQEIYFHKTPGAGTYGDIEVDVINGQGRSTKIRFFRPIMVPIKVQVSVKKLRGYSDEIGDSIKAEIIAYLAGLQIGDGVYLSSVFYAASTAQPNPYTPIYSVMGVQLSRDGDALAPADVPIAFNEAAMADVIEVIAT